ncbi:ABC transporter permease [Shewanella maritima]|uniref:ABC transporter permease n=1 Tax=Shewanella maritima TaxID=2520507 RepID=UPI003735E3D4
MSHIVKRNNWQIWKDVIFALFVREIRTGFNDKFGLAWAVINPVAFIFVLSFIRGRLDGGETHTLPTFFFMAFGLLFIQFFLDTLASTSGAMKKSKPLFAFRQVQPISAVLASSMFTLLVKVFVALTITLIMYLLGMELRLDNPLLLVTVFFLLGVVGFSLGLLFAIIICFIPEMKKIQSMMTRPLFFISGVFFSLQDMPKEMWKYFDWNPILHAIELARYSAYGSYGDTGVSLSFLSLCALSLLSLSMSVYYAYWKQAISR